MSENKDGRDCEFGEFHEKAVSVASSWRESRKYGTAECQTEEINFEEQSTEPRPTIVKSVQTDFNEKELQVQILEPPYPPSLYAFFTKVTDEMCRCLEENLDPFAFEVFKDCGDGDTSSSTSTATKEFSLHSPTAAQEKFSANCVAWNSTGTQLAVGYMALSHPESWCSHRTPLSNWNLRRINTSSPSGNIEPQVEIVLPGCVTCIEYHPLHPSVLVVGTYSGGVAIADFTAQNANAPPQDEEGQGDNDSSRYNFKQGEQMRRLGYFMPRSEHSLAVTSVHWMKLDSSQHEELIVTNKNASKYCLVSSGKDGCICVWSMNLSESRIGLERKFIIWADNIPSQVPLSLSTRCGLKQIGIVGLDVLKDDPFSCVLITFGGYIFQAKLNSNIEAYTAADAISSLTTEAKLLDPDLTYASVFNEFPQSIRCSPFHRDIVLLVSQDGQVQVKNILQEENNVIFTFDLEGGAEDVHDARWSGRPAMFGVAKGKMVHIFDLCNDQNPVLTIPQDSYVTNIAFNNAEVGTLAVSDEQGHVHIWNLPKKLTSTKLNEIDTLIKGTTM